MYFWIYVLQQRWLDKCLICPVSEDPSTTNVVRLAETLLKSGQQYLYHIYWSLWLQFSCKNSLLVICKILGLFLNTLTDDDKYSLLKRDNFFQYLQIQLSQKRKPFSQFFLAVLKFRFNLEHFQKKDDPPSRFIFELTDFEKRG